MPSLADSLAHNQQTDKNIFSSEICFADPRESRDRKKYPSQTKPFRDRAELNFPQLIGTVFQFDIILILTTSQSVDSCFKKVEPCLLVQS